MSDVYKDHYQVLGLPRNATDSEIKEAFRRLSLKYHPDKNEDGAEEFLRINEAHSVLIDHQRRAMHDFCLQSVDFEVIIPAENASCQLSELGNALFPMPPETPPGSFHKKLKVAVFIGGILVGTYVGYRVFQKPPPSIPVPRPITLPTQELSHSHLGSLWTLTSGLLALRSKRILGLGKLVPGANGRVSPRTLNAPLSSAAEVVAKTVIRGPGAVGSAATSSSSLASAANVAVKSLPGKASMNSATETVAKTLSQGSRAGPSSAFKTYSSPAVSYLRSLLNWATTPKWGKAPQAKTLSQGSRAGPSSAFKTYSAVAALLYACSKISSYLRALAGRFRKLL
ncbi:GM22100 [Drosophila sechellia]|uniref:DnaJ homolog subfamily B member 9 n=1 Tax=Drosophila sechellia TaxID=7238 RepID=B4IAY5_DROSE|nr:GM22100 [Drosophila sechellia]